jgi:uncharacterized coiled-coil protein SlyX
MKRKIKQLETANKDQLRMIQDLKAELEKQTKKNKKLSKKLKHLASPIPQTPQSKSYMPMKLMDQRALKSLASIRHH